MKATSLFVPFAPPGVLPIAGDSIPAGFGVAAGQSWGDQMVAQLRDTGVRCTFHNAGYSGETSANMLTHQAADIIARYSSSGRFARGKSVTAIAILAIGTNDLATGVAEATLRTNQNTWIDAAKAVGFYVGTVTILHRTGSLGVPQLTFDTGRDANNNYRRSQVGTREHFIIDPADDVRLSNPADGTYFQTLSFPGIHPNEAGAAVMATYGAAAMRALIAAT